MSASLEICRSRRIRSGLVSDAAAGFLRASASRSSSSQISISRSFEFLCEMATLGLAAVRTAGDQRCTTFGRRQRTINKGDALGGGPDPILGRADEGQMVQ